MLFGTIKIINRKNNVDFIQSDFIFKKRNDIIICTTEKATLF